MELYLNGNVRPDSERSILALGGSDPTDGRLDIGHMELDSTNDIGNIWMDELIIWEIQLPAEYVIKLYQAYP